MSEKRDYYEVLGVDRTATPDEIKKAYRQKARQFHPDVSDVSDAETRFKEINEAYEILSDPEKRVTFDRFGHTVPGDMGLGFDFGFRDPFEIFEEVVGRGFGFRTSTRRGPRRGADLRYDLTLTFEEAVFGAEKEIQVTRYEVCPECRGSGAEPGTSPVRCSCRSPTARRSRSTGETGAAFHPGFLCQRHYLPDVSGRGRDCTHSLFAL